MQTIVVCFVVSYFSNLFEHVVFTSYSSLFFPSPHRLSSETREMRLKLFSLNSTKHIHLFVFSLFSSFSSGFSFLFTGSINAQVHLQKRIKKKKKKGKTNEENPFVSLKSICRMYPAFHFFFLYFFLTFSF